MTYRFTPEPDDSIRLYLRVRPIGEPGDVLASLYEYETDAIDRTELLDDSLEFRGTAASLYADACATLDDPEGHSHSERLRAAAVECLLRCAMIDDDDDALEHVCAYCGGPLCPNALQPWLACTR